MKLSIETFGVGPELVMIHGWGARRAIWQNWAKTYFQGFHVTMIDLPGHGDSPEFGCEDSQIADVWQEALLEVMPANAIVLGWSLGGLMAQRMAVMTPERIDALVLLNSSPCFVQQDNWLPALEQTLFTRYMSEVMTHTAGLIKSFSALESMGSQKPRQLLKQVLALVADFSFMHVRSLRQGLLLLQTLDLRHELPLIQQPCCWVLSEKDAIVPVALAKVLPELQPSAHIVQLADVGHLPFLSCPEEAASVVLHFLTSLDHD